MTKRAARDPIYKGRRFPAETIELCVRWYITYRLSYRDLVAMMAEQGIVVSHTTIMRWVLRYVPEYERRRLSSVRRSASTVWVGRRRSTSTGTVPRIAACDCWGRRMIVGGVSTCGRAATSTT
jgi:hypothetical protein